MDTGAPQVAKDGLRPRPLQRLLDAKDTTGQTPLHRACAVAAESAAVALVAAGADVTLCADPNTISASPKLTDAVTVRRASPIGVVGQLSVSAQTQLAARNAVLLADPYGRQPCCARLASATVSHSPAKHEMAGCLAYGRVTRRTRWPADIARAVRDGCTTQQYAFQRKAANRIRHIGSHLARRLRTVAISR